MGGIARRLDRGSESLVCLGCLALRDGASKVSERDQCLDQGVLKLFDLEECPPL